MELNKIIMKILGEAVGVPDNIVETSELIYNQILEELKDINLSDGDKTKLYFNLNGDYRISDFNFKRIELELEIVKTDQVNRTKLAGMAFIFVSELDNELLKLKHKHTEDVVELQITIAIPDDVNIESSDISELFIKDGNRIVSSLTHELMHSYDNYKKSTSNIKDRSSYNTYNSSRFGIPAIDDFIFNLYFIHSIENIVRPSEVAADLKRGDIQRDEFLEFLKNNRVYRILKEINNFSYENLKKELLKDTDTIRLRLNQSGINDIPENDKELVEKILELLMINITNSKVSEFRNMLSTSIFEEILGFNGRKENVFNNYIKKVNKYKNYDDFFRNEEKMFKSITNNLIRKIHKLYSIINHKETNESIIDWDLYHKIKKTPIIIETEFEHTPEKRKLKLIQNYLDNILVPGNDLICKAEIHKHSSQDEYFVTLWVNTTRALTKDESEDLVDITWDEIYNMFEIPVSVRRIKSEC